MRGKYPTHLSYLDLSNNPHFDDFLCARIFSVCWRNGHVKALSLALLSHVCSIDNDKTKTHYTVPSGFLNNISDIPFIEQKRLSHAIRKYKISLSRERGSEVPSISVASPLSLYLPTYPYASHHLLYETITESMLVRMREGPKSSRMGLSGTSSPSILRSGSMVFPSISSAYDHTTKQTQSPLFNMDYISEHIQHISQHSQTTLSLSREAHLSTRHKKPISRTPVHHASSFGPSSSYQPSPTHSGSLYSPVASPSQPKHRLTLPRPNPQSELVHIDIRGRMLDCLNRSGDDLHEYEIESPSQGIRNTKYRVMDGRKRAVSPGVSRTSRKISKHSGQLFDLLNSINGCHMFGISLAGVQSPQQFSDSGHRIIGEDDFCEDEQMYIPGHKLILSSMLSTSTFFKTLMRACFENESIVSDLFTLSRTIPSPPSDSVQCSMTCSFCEHDSSIQHHPPSSLGSLASSHPYHDFIVDKEEILLSQLTWLCSIDESHTGLGLDGLDGISTGQTSYSRLGSDVDLGSPIGHHQYRDGNRSISELSPLHSEASISPKKQNTDFLSSLCEFIDREEAASTSGSGLCASSFVDTIHSALVSSQLVPASPSTLRGKPLTQESVRTESGSIDGMTVETIFSQDNLGRTHEPLDVSDITLHKGSSITLGESEEKNITSPSVSTFVSSSSRTGNGKREINMKGKRQKVGKHSKNTPSLQHVVYQKREKSTKGNGKGRRKQEIMRQKVHDLKIGIEKYKANKKKIENTKDLLPREEIDMHKIKTKDQSFVKHVGFEGEQKKKKSGDIVVILGNSISYSVESLESPLIRPPSSPPVQLIAKKPPSFLAPSSSSLSSSTSSSSSYSLGSAIPSSPLLGHVSFQPSILDINLNYMIGDDKEQGGKAITKEKGREIVQQSSQTKMESS
ncbi:hypothetical protein ADUPG1_010548, partial [Aduncisulcus paluster]